MIVKATKNDLDRIDEIAVAVITDMKASNIPQWDYNYPRKQHYIKDIENNALYVYKDNGKILGAVTLMTENDPPYQTIDGWLTKNSMVIHRVVVDPTYRNQRVAQSLFDFCYQVALKENYQSIKIDTHQDNYKMKRFLEKNGFVEIGYLEVINRMAYEKLFKED